MGKINYKIRGINKFLISTAIFFVTVSNVQATTSTNNGSLFNKFSLLANAHIAVDIKNNKLLNKFNTFIDEITKNKITTDVEKYEAQKTVESIYSFAKEISEDHSSFYEPKMTEWINSERKFAGDNPDAQYFSAFIDPNAEYKISASMNNLVFLEVTSYRQEKGINRVSNSVIVSNKEGEYSLKLALDKKANPDLKLHKNDYIIIVRYYRKDASILAKSPEIITTKRPKVERKVDSNFRDKVAFNMMESLYRSSEFLTKQMQKVVNGYAAGISTNNPFASNLYPNTSVAYDGAFVDIPEGSYLSLKGQIDTSKYFVFLFYNKLWATPFSDKIKFFNINNLKADKDGNYEIVISREPMDADNNIVLGKLTRGIFSIRTVDRDFESPHIEVKKK